MEGRAEEPVSQCALHIRGQMCMPPDDFKTLCVAVGLEPKVDNLGALLKTHEVRHEHELWDKSAVQTAIPSARVILDTCYKPLGPHDPKPLSNDEIDNVLWQWERRWPDFCNPGFTMMDFASYGGTPMQLLAALPALQAGKGATFVSHELRGVKHACSSGPPRRRFAIVLNSDTISGPGKHWTCIFIDLANVSGPTIEFFNSSGNAPYPEVLHWVPLAQRAIGAAMGAETAPQFVPVTAIRHQRGNTECGVYALYYIWSRLNGQTAESFKHGEIPDDKMTDFRATHLFRSS